MLVKEKLKQWIEDHAEDLALGSYSIQDVSEGERNIVLKVTGAEELIVRTNSPMSKGRIDNEHKMLLFLAEHGVEYVPRAVLFVEKAEFGQVVLVETSVGDQQLDCANLTDEQIESLVAVLSDIHRIPIASFNDAFGTQHRESITLGKFLAADILMKQRFYDSYCDTVDVPEPVVSQAFDEMKHIAQAKQDAPEVMVQTVVHGDVGINLRSSGNQVYLIDFEDGGVHSPIFEFAEFFAMSKVKPELQEKILDAYLRHQEVPHLKELVPFLMEWFCLGSIVWGARRLGRAMERDPSKVPRYEKWIADYRAYLDELRS